MTVTPAVAHLIREGKTEQLDVAIHSGKDAGMLPLEKDLARLVKFGPLAARSRPSPTPMTRRYSSTEEDPTAPELYLDLPAGDYLVYLEPGYRVEQIPRDTQPWQDAGALTSDGSGPCPADAGAGACDPRVRLISHNPARATVHTNNDFLVNFTFEINGAPVTTNHGGLIINADFVDKQAGDAGVAPVEAYGKE